MQDAERTLGVFDAEVAVTDFRALEALGIGEADRVRFATSGARPLPGPGELRHELADRELLVPSTVLVKVLADDSLARAGERWRCEEGEREEAQQRCHASHAAVRPATDARCECGSIFGYIWV